MKINVLDHGFIELRNISGPTRRLNSLYDADDTDPANAARMSFGQMDSGRTREQDLKLCEYLVKNRHCYHPDMQVLTIEGWKCWKDCDTEESFLVPDPATGKYSIEKLPIETYDACEELITYKNSRMSYAVTSDHKMRFMPKYQSTFGAFKASDMLQWGHFDTMSNYSLVDKNVEVDPQFSFIGFYLGDGSYSCLNRVTFHLKKDRKKQYLESLLKVLDIPYTVKVSSTYADALIYNVTTPDFLKEALGVYLPKRSKEKQFPVPLETLTANQIVGLLDGLVNSDGSIKSDRPQVEFSSFSENILSLFQTLNALVGTDAHQSRVGHTTNATAYYGGRTSLEARKQFFSTEYYEGKVCCTTTSTGWLMVRGRPTDFGFVCGNSTPLEMIECWIEMKLPMFVARQFVRHRTCLSGDTDITFELPNRVKNDTKGAKTLKLSELYSKWNIAIPDMKYRYGKTIREHKQKVISNMSLRVYNENTKEFTVGHIGNITMTGVKPVYKVSLANGKTLKCTDDHRLLTTIGWETLEDAVGLGLSTNGVATMSKQCSIMTNGVPAYQSYDWMANLRNSGDSVLDMATKAGCSYHTIRKWLKVHNLNFTRSEAAKRTKIWNRGLKYKQKKQFEYTPESKQRIIDARSGTNSNWWKGGITKERNLIGAWSTSKAAQIHKKNGYACVTCGSKDELECHHIKPVVTHPEEAYNIENLTTLCRVCHRKEHGILGTDKINKSGTKLVAKPSKVINVELVGEEPTYDISVAGEHHNFVANGFVVHNCTINEVSGRYVTLPEEWYIPETVGGKAANAKQGQEDNLSEEAQYKFKKTLNDACARDYEAYVEAINEGVAAEHARMLLHLNHYTTWLWKQNLSNIFHFLSLRDHGHAQIEAQLYAKAIDKVIRSVLPESMALYDKYRKQP